MSVSPAGSRARPSETIAGVLAAAALFAGLVATAYRPMRIGPFAIFFALLAAGLGGRHGRLAATAVAVSTAGWIVGMVIAVLTKHKIF